MRPDAAIDDARKRDEENYVLGNHLDQNYVDNFLKEIDDIETINHRANKYIEDRAFET